MSNYRLLTLIQINHFYIFSIAEDIYDKPRSESDDHFEGFGDDELDDNENRVNEDEEKVKQQIEEYKVFGRMTEKEVQLALLMKRVKERYITQEQALEMARVLRLEVLALFVMDKMIRSKCSRQRSSKNHSLLVQSCYRKET